MARDDGDDVIADYEEGEISTSRTKQRGEDPLRRTPSNKNTRKNVHGRFASSHSVHFVSVEPYAGQTKQMNPFISQQSH